MGSIKAAGFVVQIFANGGRCKRVGLLRCEGLFDGVATCLAELLAGCVAAFEDFDAVVGVGVVRGGDVNGEIETHLIETVVDGGGGENTDAGVFDAE